MNIPFWGDHTKRDIWFLNRNKILQKIYIYNLVLENIKFHHQRLWINKMTSLNDVICYIPYMYTRLKLLKTHSFVIERLFFVKLAPPSRLDLHVPISVRNSFFWHNFCHGQHQVWAHRLRILYNISWKTRWIYVYWLLLISLTM